MWVRRFQKREREMKTKDNIKIDTIVQQRFYQKEKKIVRQRGLYVVIIERKGEGSACMESGFSYGRTGILPVGDF